MIDIRPKVKTIGAKPAGLREGLSDLRYTTSRMGPKVQKGPWGNGDSEEQNERLVVAPAIAPTGPPSMLSQPRGPLESRMTVAVRQSSLEKGDGRNFVAFLAFKIRADGMRDEPC